MDIGHFVDALYIRILQHVEMKKVLNYMKINIFYLVLLIIVAYLYHEIDLYHIGICYHTKYMHCGLCLAFHFGLLATNQKK